MNNKPKSTLQKLTVSVGFKRRLTALLAVVRQLAASFTFLTPVIPVLDWLAAMLGGVAVTHAAVEGTVKEFPAATITSVLAMLRLLATFWAPLQAYIPFIDKLILMVGTVGVTNALNKA